MKLSCSSEAHGNLLENCIEIMHDGVIVKELDGFCWIRFDSLNGSQWPRADAQQQMDRLSLRPLFELDF